MTPNIAQMGWHPPPPPSNPIIIDIDSQDQNLSITPRQSSKFSNILKTESNNLMQIIKN
jgi:hypothetical protein